MAGIIGKSGDGCCFNWLWLIFFLSVLILGITLILSWVWWYCDQ